MIVYKETGPAAGLELLKAPEDIESVDLRAALLLEMGQADECLATLALTETGHELQSHQLTPGAETFRIRALAHLATKNIAYAQLDIQKALVLEPRWERIRHTAAVMQYFSALAHVAIPDRLVPWPEPLDWALIKRDDASLRFLREASAIFRELAEAADRTKEERQTLETWCLACLMNDPDRQEEALTYCQQVLQTDVTHYRVIAWVTARNLGIDLTPSEHALEHLIHAGKAHLLHILALAGCYFVSHTPQRAIALLQDAQSRFTEHDAQTLWTFWYTQALVVNGTLEAAVQTIDSVGSSVELRRMRTIVLQAVARKMGDWQAVLQHLERGYEETGNPHVLFDSCELMAQQREWAYVADRAQQLVQAIGISEALRLAAVATYEAKRFPLCLRLLDEHADFFRQQKLPEDLRRLRSHCQHALGIIPQALAEAEGLTREAPTAENLFALAQLYCTKGDLKSLALIARQLYVQPNLPAESLLRVARLIRLEDRELPTSLWRRAIEDLPDSIVGEAFSQGYQLGLDEELRPVWERMVRLGQLGQGGVQGVTIGDLITLATRRRQLGAKLDEAYRHGTLPIHVVEEQVRRPLVDFYHRFLTEHEADPNLIQQFSLFIRHGGRTPVPDFPVQEARWRLHLDVTALLLAHHLGILPIVEQAFAPLHIPPTLIPALVGMLDRLQPHQPSRYLVYKQIVDLVERGACQVAHALLAPAYENTPLVEELGAERVAFFESARTSRGYLVDFLPLHKRDLSGPPSTLPEDAAQYVVNCRAIVETLYQQGPLSPEGYGRVLCALGNEGQCDASPSLPVKGSPLFCYGRTPEVRSKSSPQYWAPGSG